MNSQSSTLKRVLLNIGLVVMLLLFSVGILFYIVLPRLTNKDREVTVPDLSGMNIDEAITFLKKRDLDFSLGDSTYQSSMRPFAVVYQFPEPLSKVKVHRKINLRLNASVPPSIKFPDLQNSTVEFVRRQIELLDLKVGNLKIRNGIQHESVAEFSVNGKPIRPGDLIQKGSSIDMVVELDSTRH